MRQIEKLFDLVLYSLKRHEGRYNAGLDFFKIKRSG